MAKQAIRRALISVYDKTGVVDFARALSEEFGIEIISTGGTAKLLAENKIPVTPVEDVTGFPEMMDGRVKTLHPKIHAGILADRDNPEHLRQLKEQGIDPIDMVVVNLYPFEETIADPDCTFEQAIEMIDIGGPCLLRAAAKNHRHVLVCNHTSMYDAVLKKLRSRDSGRGGADAFHAGALSAFEETTTYDAEVFAWLVGQGDSRDSKSEVLRLVDSHKLRYGENPHQQGEVFSLSKDSRSFELSVGGSAMSFNNYVDADAAARLCSDVAREIAERPAKCIFVKHTNACGTGMADDPIEAYRSAYLGDPNAAMGGILACSFNVTPDFADAVMNTYDRWGKAAGAGGFFIEVWVARGFDDEAKKIIRESKKWGERVRFVEIGSFDEAAGDGGVEYKTISGGILKQTRDNVGLNEDQWTVVTKRRPTDQELADLRLAWLVCKHTKSNAITICADGMLIGNGAGQMSRVMSCRIATWLANDNGHTDKLQGAAAASDAFFPFRDGPDLLIDAGVSAIIQPGGSKRDADTIAACDERGVAMVFTGTRHFKH